MRSLKLIRGHRYFEAQERDEEALLVVRMHWFILISPFFWGMLATAAICGFTYIALHNDTKIFDPAYAELIYRAIFSLGLLFGSLVTFGIWLTRYLNLMILTNQHIVDVTQTAYFSRKISTLALDSIEDVAVEKKGFLPNVFDYGNLNIQTAGELPNFNIDRIGDPEGVQKAIMEAKEKFADHR